jgi:hypothetical protein
VKPTYGLTDEQVESMILDSFDHAEEDFAKRLLIEARNEAETILAAVERAPQSPAWKQLTGEEQAAIARRATACSPSSWARTGRHSRSDAGARPGHARFAELMMDAAVTTAIRGKTMERGRRGVGRSRHRAPSHGPAEFK